MSWDLKVGSKVWVNIDESRSDLLHTRYEIYTILTGILMQGTIQENRKNQYVIYLDTAEETFMFPFPHEKTFEL